MVQPRSLYYRIWAAVNELSNIHNASEFGRLAQVLLALTFQDAGFKLSHFQQVGRPDFVAQRNDQDFAVEVKAPSGNEVLIKREDLMGVRNLGHPPVVAVLTYPMLDTRWLIVACGSLIPRLYEKIELTKYDLNNLSEEINVSFLSVLGKYREQAMLGSSYAREFLQTD